MKGGDIDMRGIEIGIVTPELEKNFARVEANQAKLAAGESLKPVTQAEKKVATVVVAPKEQFAIEREARVAATGKVGRVEIYTKVANGAAAHRR